MNSKEPMPKAEKEEEIRPLSLEELEQIVGGYKEEDFYDEREKEKLGAGFGHFAANGCGMGCDDGGDDGEELDKRPGDDDGEELDKKLDDDREELDKRPGDDDGEEPGKRPGDDREELDKKLGDDGEEPDKRPGDDEEEASSSKIPSSGTEKNVNTGADMRSDVYEHLADQDYARGESSDIDGWD